MGPGRCWRAAHAPPRGGWPIAKGKASNRNEFGCRTSLPGTSKGGWSTGARACPGNDYDRHTLECINQQLERLAGRSPESVSVDMGHRWRDYVGSAKLHVDRRHRLRIQVYVEPDSVPSGDQADLGHPKNGEHLDGTHRVKGTPRDKLSMVLNAAGMNLAELLSGRSPMEAFLS